MDEQLDRDRGVPQALEQRALRLGDRDRRRALREGIEPQLECRELDHSRTSVDLHGALDHELSGDRERVAVAERRMQLPVAVGLQLVVRRRRRHVGAAARDLTAGRQECREAERRAETRGAVVASHCLAHASLATRCVHAGGDVVEGARVALRAVVEQLRLAASDAAGEADHAGDDRRRHAGAGGSEPGTARLAAAGDVDELARLGHRGEVGHAAAGLAAQGCRCALLPCGGLLEYRLQPLTVPVHAVSPPYLPLPATFSCVPPTASTLGSEEGKFGSPL